MKRQRAIITEPAQEDLDVILGHLVLRNADAALALLNAVEELVSLLAQGLLEGRAVTLSTGERVLHVRDARRESLER